MAVKSGPGSWLEESRRRSADIYRLFAQVADAVSEVVMRIKQLRETRAKPDSSLQGNREISKGNTLAVPAPSAREIVRGVKNRPLL